MFWVFCFYVERLFVRLYIKVINFRIEIYFEDLFFVVFFGKVYSIFGDFDRKWVVYCKDIGKLNIFYFLFII